MTVSECKYKIQELRKRVIDSGSALVPINDFSELLDICSILCNEIDNTKYELEDVIEEYETQIEKEQKYAELYRELLTKTNDALCNMIDFIKDRGGEYAEKAE